ncbi:MAG: signal peptidase I [Candidatus Hydrogenedentes bacterium]|nr:signal peptidase I [Candidatus Hydrogenedentota bacterium]
MNEARAERAQGILVRLLTSHRAGLLTILVLCLIGIYFFAFRGMRFFEVPSRSMEPALLPGDHLITLWEKAYRRGDIVVVEEDDGYVVKRVVGLPGDEVMVMDGALFIDGAYASEPYIAEPMLYVLAPLRVPDGCVFLLGDNRNASDDDHLTRQAQPAVSIVGRVRFRYYPYDRWGRIHSFPLSNVRSQ